MALGVPDYLMIENVREFMSKHLQCPIDKVLYGMRYSEMLGVSILLTAKANTEAERVTKMENEMTKQK